MTTIKMLGVGNIEAINLYNTCFAIQNSQGVFLIDSGRSEETIYRLYFANVELEEIKNIFISHSHLEHMLGLMSIFKIMRAKLACGKIIEPINVYCNDVVFANIQMIATRLLLDSVQTVFHFVNFIILKDRDKYTINGIDYEFFDILARETKQFGFSCHIYDKRFCFLGDEPLNPLLYDYVRGSNTVMHEAFCLEADDRIFRAYAKQHSTAFSAAKIMSQLDVEHLILYNTEDSHGKERENLYRREAEMVYDGYIHVPNDRDELVLVRK